jgi:hypothetical protein
VYETLNIKMRQTVLSNMARFHCRGRGIEPRMP